MSVKGVFHGLLVSVIGTAFVLSLFFIAYGMAFNLVTSNRNEVKNILAKSDLYENLPPLIYNDLKSDTKSPTVPLKDPAVRRIALSVFDPELTQKTIENLVDGTYDWLEGKTDKLSASVDLTGAKNKLASQLGDYAEKKATKLPTCSYGQLRQMAAENSYSVFNAKCLPPYLTATEINKQIKSEINKSDEFLKDTKVKVDDLKDEKGQTLTQSAPNLPAVFAAAKLIPAVLFVFALALAYALVKLSDSTEHGLKRLIKYLVISGVFIILAPIVLLDFSKFLLDNAAAQQDVVNIVRSVLEQYINAVSKVYYVCGGLALAGAIGIYLYLRQDTGKPKAAK